MDIANFEQLAFTIIDKWLSYRMHYSTQPGVQLCVRKKGEIIFSKAYGYADVTAGQALTTDQLFHIASHSKSFTACLILQLVEERHLDLQQSIVHYLPAFQAHCDPRFKNITVRDLLANRSGLFRDGPDSEFWDFQKTFPARQHLIDEIFAMPLVYEPGTKTKYSNYGFGLLGLLIEKVTGLSYGQVLETHIFQKLGLSNIFADYTDQIERQMVKGYSRPLKEGRRTVFKHEPTHALASATGICANAENASLFFYEVLHGEKLLSRAMRKEMLSLKWPIPNPFGKEHYGLGLEFDTHEKIEWVGHSGGYPGFVTLTAHWLNTDYTISVLANANDVPVMNFWLSIPSLLEKLKLTFDEKELEHIAVGGPFLTVWNSSLFAISPTKALCLWIDKALLTQNALVFQADSAGKYFCDQENGFGSLGETLTFDRDSQGQILDVKWGGDTLYPEERFQQNLQAAGQ